MLHGNWTARPLGDRALLLVKDSEGMALRNAAAVARQIRELGLPWLQEAVPAYRSIAVYIRSPGVPVSRAEEQLLSRLEALPEPDDRIGAKTVEIPVVYGGEDGPDLADSAARSGMSEERFAQEHSQAEYEVAMIGFAPGFPYLSGLPERLAQPRRDTPRLRVPAGSVGIAGAQTGVYPVDSSGGWQIVGRTDERLFRQEAEEPFLLAPGDRVKFMRVAKRDAEGGAPPAPMRSGRTERRSDPALTVMKPGMLTTVQDAGRPGWRAYGVGAGGAMDERARRTANALVGNAEEAAALEFTLLGATFATERPALIAVSGAEIEASVDGEAIPMNAPIAVRAGATLSFGRATAGCRAYMAIAGGIDVPLALGSRSADTRAGIGPAALSAGERLAVGEPTALSLALIDALLREAKRSGRSWAAAAWRASDGIGPFRQAGRQRA